MENTPSKKTIISQIQANQEKKPWLSIIIPTLKHAVDPSIPQLNTLINKEGLDKVELFLDDQIDKFLDFYNVKTTMNAVQVQMTRNLIIKEYSYLRPTEIRCFFDNCMLSKYGKVYDRMDGSIILEWLKMFVVERDKVISDLRLQENSQHKKGDDILSSLQTMGLYNFRDLKKANNILDMPMINDKKDEDSNK